jgi:hypothetical protein
MIEDTVEQQLQVCADAALFSEFVGQTVVAGQPRVTLTFARDVTLLRATYPVTIRGRQQDIIVDRRYPLRMLHFFEYAQALMLADGRDPLFRFENAFVYVSPLVGVDLNRLSNMPLAAYWSDRADYMMPTVDIITMTDTASVFRGRMLALRFLIEDRPPVADEACTIAVDPDDGDIASVMSEQPCMIETLYESTQPISAQRAVPPPPPPPPAP